jgi:hypothetical protein
MRFEMMRAHPDSRRLQLCCDRIRAGSLLPAQAMATSSKGRRRRRRSSPARVGGPALADVLRFSRRPLSSAKVAELADAPDLGSGSRKAMGVRLPPFAPACARWLRFELRLGGPILEDPPRSQKTKHED